MSAKRTRYQNIYKRLVRLYPQDFRKRFGESLEQTFGDLCRERQGRLSFGFIAWVAVETSVGVVREHINEFRKRGLMGFARTNFRLSAIIGFLFILPFMTLALIFDNPYKLNGFSLSATVDFLILFALIWIQVTLIAWFVMPMIRSGGAANGITEPGPESGLTKFIADPAPSAVISFVLALPQLIFVSMLLIGIYPHIVLKQLLSEPEAGPTGVFSSIIMLSIPILAIMACFVARAPIVRTMRSGGGLFAHPLNLLLMVVILLIFAKGVLSLVVDQFPCWIGVPNCD